MLLRPARLCCSGLSVDENVENAGVVGAGVSPIHSSVDLRGRTGDGDDGAGEGSAITAAVASGDRCRRDDAGGNATGSRFAVVLGFLPGPRFGGAAPIIDFTFIGEQSSAGCCVFFIGDDTGSVLTHSMNGESVVSHICSHMHIAIEREAWSKLTCSKGFAPFR